MAVRDRARERDGCGGERIADPDAQRFVEIPTVAAGLDQQSIAITRPSDASEIALTAQNCPVNQLLTSPLANQCCYDGAQTLFAKESSPYARNVVTRHRNPYGTECKASNGTGSCSGTACYYGPLGYSLPSSQTYVPNYYAHITGGSSCGIQWIFQSGGADGFTSIEGTQPRGQGCPGGNSSAGYWDYTY